MTDSWDPVPFDCCKCGPMHCDCTNHIADAIHPRGVLPAPPRDWGYEAHQAAVKHLDACDEWMVFYDEGEPEDLRPAGEDPSIAPYDGCQDCTVREALYAAWPIIEEAVRSGDFDPTPRPSPEETERALQQHRIDELNAGRCCHCLSCMEVFTYGHLADCPKSTLTKTVGATPGPWTSHGHDIPGKTVAGEQGRPPKVRCGGPGLCAQCSLEAGMFHTPSHPSWFDREDGR